MSSESYPRLRRDAWDLFLPRQRGEVREHSLEMAAVDGAVRRPPILPGGGRDALRW